MIFLLFFLLISFFSQFAYPVKASQSRGIAMLSKIPQGKYQAQHFENKKILNSKKVNHTRINKSPLLWDIPLRRFVILKLNPSEEDLRYKKVLDYLITEKIRKSSELKFAYDYIAKPFFSRSFTKIFRNPSKLSYSKAEAIILKAEKQIKQDLEVYTRYFSSSEVKLSIHEEANFLDLEKLLINDYGLNSINYINHLYSKYPSYHYDS